MDPVVNRKERTIHLDWITEHWDRIGQFFAAFASDHRVCRTFVLKYNIRTRSLADPGTIEDVLAVENDVVPFDRADGLGAGLRPGLPG